MNRHPKRAQKRFKRTNPAGRERAEREKIKKLKLLLEFGKRNVREKSLDSLLERLADEAKTLLEADRCSIFILNSKSKILWSKVAHGTSQIISIPWDKGIAGEAARSGKTLKIPNAYRDRRFNPEVDKSTGYKTRSILAEPMKNLRDEVLGVFQVLNKKSAPAFSKEDEEILSILVSQAAAAIENVRLHAQVQEASQDTIYRLAAAAEYKDRDTGSHIIRMSKYSSLIAEAFGCADEFCRNILLASPLHDIGKLGVADAILTKPGELDAEEWTEMRRHTLYGAEILKDSSNELIQMSYHIALTHHEKYDGTGYPNRLRGDDIPLEGRIIALADVFDALVSKRVYKNKLPLEEALSVIRAGSGKHFDPKVVRAFEKALPKMVEVMERHRSEDEGEAAATADRFPAPFGVAAGVNLV